MRMRVGLWIDHRKAIVVAVETVDKMTNRQIAAKVRKHFDE